jgi:Type IV secretion system pilin
MNLINIKKLLIVASLVLLPSTVLASVAIAAPVIANDADCTAAKGTWKPISGAVNGGYCDTGSTPLPSGLASTLHYTQAECATSKGEWKPAGTSPTGTAFDAYCDNPVSLPASYVPPTVACGGTADSSQTACRDKDNTTTTPATFKVDAEAKATCTDANLDASNCPIVDFANTAFSAIAGFIGLAVTGNIIWAGIQYSMSQGDPSKASKAKDRIRGAIIALIMFLSLSAFIEWLIPGGIFP